MIEEINDLKWIPYFLVFLLVINPTFADSNFSNIQRMVSAKKKISEISSFAN